MRLVDDMRSRADRLETRAGGYRNCGCKALARAAENAAAALRQAVREEEALAALEHADRTMAHEG